MIGEPDTVESTGLCGLTELLESISGQKFGAAGMHDQWVGDRESHGGTLAWATSTRTRRAGPLAHDASEESAGCSATVLMKTTPRLRTPSSESYGA